MTLQLLLLKEAESVLRLAVSAGDMDAAIAIFRRVVRERTEVMHLRAQAAESRASKAERVLDRVVRL